MYAISVDSPQKAGEIKGKLKLSFPVLSDANGNVARRWGVLDIKTEIAKPATFVIKRGGTIVFKKVGKDMTDRPHADDLLKLAAKARADG